MTLPPVGRAVVIGDALIDELRDGVNKREFVGGAALNVAVGLARLGVPTTLVAMVGDDEPGGHIRAYLDDYGVELIASDAPLGTARAVSTRTAAGEPDYAFNEAARRRLVRLDAASGALADAAFVAISCVAFDDAEQADEIDRALAGTSAAIAVDPNPRSGMLHDRAAFVDGFERVAGRAALVKVGDDDAALLYGAALDAVRGRLARSGAGAVLATRGRLGAEVEAGDVHVARPIAAVPGAIVDTMGAGDAVFASTVASLMAEPPADAAAWDRILDRAMEVAAATCRFEGALLRLPSALTGLDLDRLDT
jgi:fructokinase